jgi:hypothetical protein
MTANAGCLVSVGRIAVTSDLLRGAGQDTSSVITAIKRLAEKQS